MTELPQTRNALIADPGGVRGIHELVAMARVEKKTGKAIHELYDLHAGTSTGIIALCLVLLKDPKNPAKAKYTAEQAAEIFEKFAKVVFPPPTLISTARQLFSDKAKYDAKPYEEALERIFGDTRVRDLLGNPMFYATHARSRKTVCIHRIRKDDGTLYRELLSDMRVRDVIRGATTAPTFHAVRWDYPLNPDDPHSKKIGLLDGGNAAGGVPHEVNMTLEKISPPGARRVLSHYRTGSARISVEEGRTSRIGGLLGTIVDEFKREQYLNWTFNGPTDRTSDVLQWFQPEDYFSFLAPIDNRRFPDHPTMRLDGAGEENMRRHRVRMNAWLDEKEKEQGNPLERHCADLMERFREPEPAVLAAPEKSGPVWKRPEVAEALKGFGVPLVKAWEKTKKIAVKVVNENRPQQRKPKPPKQG